ncbi:MAG: 50S ribosomal protein L11 methyltransferase [Acidobacteriia bacterium]|nr:50S ribosomal protein L11 methyltransferase [Terriglobia bacterium]
MKYYPAIDVRGDSTDLLLVAVDDYSPTAIEERDDSVRVFFATTEIRDTACAALATQFIVEAIDVPDEDWAKRSQEGLTPITVGRITVAPPWSVSSQPPATSHQPPIVITILPSMGFGTGHHATTRLCLDALQAIDLKGAVLLDVGTGSGVLAIAGARLGAARVVAIDVDPDAIQSARENLAMNPDARNVTFEMADLTSAALPKARVVTANLTGALLVKSAPLLLAATEPGGVLILSGLLAHERDEVCRAFTPAAVCRARAEDGWLGLTMKIS